MELMTFEEWAEQMWQQIGRLDAECELLERKLNRITADGEKDSPESETIARQLNELGAQLLRLDEEYSALLRQGGWLDG